MKDVVSRLFFGLQATLLFGVLTGQLWAQANGKPTEDPAGHDAGTGNKNYRIEKGLVFSDVDPNLTLDLYLPTQFEQAVPCILVIQGGGFIAQDGQRSHAFAEYFAEHGMAAALISYRGRPAHRYMDTIADTKAAVRFVRSQSARYRLDPERIGAMGRSAGGTLAALLAVTGDDPQFERQGRTWIGGHPDISSRIQAAAAQAGVFDFVSRFTSKEQLAIQPNHAVKEQTNGEWIGAPFSPTNEHWVRASAVRHVDRGDPPVLLMHCQDDRTVPWQQSKEFHRLISAQNDHSEYFLFSEGGHGFRETGADTNAIMLNFFRRVF